MRKTSGLFAMAGAAAAVLGLAFAWPWLVGRIAGDDASAATVALGKTIYSARCSSCHGARLEGQRDWKRQLPSGRMPAPPHDASGHTWHHPDDVLFRITRDGPAVIVGGGYQSDMPGFGNVLADEEIRAVLAFIKSTWPERERRHQAEMSRRERARAQ